MNFKLHDVYTPEEISGLKAGKKSFEVVPARMYLWLYDDKYQYRFAVISGSEVELVDKISLGDAENGTGATGV